MIGLGSQLAMPTIAELQAKLEAVRREVHNPTVMSMQPDQLALIKNLECSARASLKQAAPDGP